ncbi:MAG: glycoside hydrolase family protein [Gammaproteobacteria bacterium]
MDSEKLSEDLIRDEGLRLKPYRDTVGKLTIGYGRNIDDVGISESEARSMLANDIAAASNECESAFGFWPRLGEGQQRALVNMAFNMGLPRLRGFRNMLAALEAGNYDTAADEALDSRWARQVGDRAQRVADLMRGV